MRWDIGSSWRCWRHEGACAGLSTPILQVQQEIKSKVAKDKATPLRACRASGNCSCVASTRASMPSPWPALGASAVRARGGWSLEVVLS
jgi:hypothetical protein